MAEVAKVEFYVIDACGEAVDWFDTLSDAIGRASALGEGWRVQKVTHYLDDREDVYP